MPTRSRTPRKAEDDPILYSIPGLKKIRDRLLFEFRMELELPGQKLTLPLIEHTVDQVMFLLPPTASAILMFQDEPEYAMEERREVAKIQHNRRETVRQCFSSFAGQVMTVEMVKIIAARLSGWWDEAAAGKERPLWQGIKSWALLHVYDMERIPCKGEMYRVRIRSYAGPSAGEEWSCTYTGGRLKYLLREAKCSRYVTVEGYREYAEYDPMDTCGIWFIGRVTFAQGRLSITDICASSSVEKSNKDLQAQRREICVGPFPTFKGKKTCSMCPVSTRACPNARSAVPYSKVDTCRCGKRGYFRPDGDSKGWCLSCLSTGNYKNVKKANPDKRKTTA